MKNCHSFEHVADTMPVIPRNSEMLALEFFVIQKKTYVVVVSNDNLDAATTIPTRKGLIRYTQINI